MIQSHLGSYSDAYIHVKEAITIPNTEIAATLSNRNNKVTFKNYAPFANCISEINNKQVDNAHDINLVMPMSNLIKYSNIYSKASESLWKCYRDEPA